MLTQTKVHNLREKIKARTAELNIEPDHDITGHYYKFGEQRYPSVTGRLQILKDPSLANWKMNRALDYLMKAIINDDPRVTGKVNINELIEEAKMVPQQEFEGAGSIGTTVHNWREEWFKAVIDNGYEITNERAINPMGLPAVISACRGIQKFVKECDYQPVGCELYVADHVLQTGGQVDDIGFVNGELALVDLKTSNIGDKESYYAQVALYLYMFRRLYKVRPKKLYILHVSKKDGTYKLINIPNIGRTINWARKVVQVTQGLEEIRESKKKQTISI